MKTARFAVTDADLINCCRKTYHWRSRPQFDSYSCNIIVVPMKIVRSAVTDTYIIAILVYCKTVLPMQGKHFAVFGHRSATASVWLFNNDNTSGWEISNLWSYALLQLLLFVAARMGGSFVAEKLIFIIMIMILFGSGFSKIDPSSKAKLVPQNVYVCFLL